MALPLLDRPESSPRCRDCQLQLCKSRTEPPHGALKETARDEVHNRTQFACATCGAAMVRNGDLSKPGWSHPRPA